MFIYFLFYSFIGWIGDTAYRSFDAGKFQEGSFLHLPLCPVYGFGALIVLFLNRFFSGFPLLAQFVFYGILLAAFEFLTGYLVCTFFNRRLWCYRGTFLNFGEYTDAFHAVLWGVVALLFLQLHPFIQNVLGVYAIF